MWGCLFSVNQKRWLQPKPYQTWDAYKISTLSAYTFALLLLIVSADFLQSEKAKTNVQKMSNWYQQSSLWHGNIPFSNEEKLSEQVRTMWERTLLSFGRRRAGLWEGGMLSNGARSKAPSLPESSTVGARIIKVLLQTSCTSFLKFPGNSSQNM